jgi:hypothetical protein
MTSRRRDVTRRRRREATSATVRPRSHYSTPAFANVAVVQSIHRRQQASLSRHPSIRVHPSWRRPPSPETSRQNNEDPCLTAGWQARYYSVRIVQAGTHFATPSSAGVLRPARKVRLLRSSTKVGRLTMDRRLIAIARADRRERLKLQTRWRPKLPQSRRSVRRRREQAASGARSDHQRAPSAPRAQSAAVAGSSEANIHSGLSSRIWLRATNTMSPITAMKNTVGKSSPSIMAGQ